MAAFLTFGKTVANMKHRSVPIAIAFLTVAGLLGTTAPAKAQADPYFWIGAVDNNWSTFGNWVQVIDIGGTLTPIPADPPQNLTTTQLIFSADLGTFNFSTVDIAFQANALFFLGPTAGGGGTGPVTFTVGNSGQTLTLGNGGIGIQNTMNAPLISTAIALGANQSWTHNGLDQFNVTGPINTNAFTLTMPGPSHSNISGVISGTGNIVMNGTGTTTFSGTSPNTYSGTTDVSFGTLLVNKAHTGTGAYTVHTGGTLGGTGTVSAPVTVDNTGKLAPGTSVGTLTVNNSVVLQSGSTFKIELTGGSNASDRLIANSLTIAEGSALELTLFSGILTGNERFTIVQSGTSVSGTFVGLPNSDLTGNPITGFSVPLTLYYNATVAADNVTIIESPGVISIIATPEPGCIVAVGALATGVWFRLRRNFS
jgi:autotransporter-associated beta strand protein